MKLERGEKDFFFFRNQEILRQTKIQTQIQSERGKERIEIEVGRRRTSIHRVWEQGDED